MTYVSLAHSIRGLRRGPHIAVIIGIVVVSGVVAASSVIVTAGNASLAWWWPAVGIAAAAGVAVTPSARPWVALSYGIAVALASAIGGRLPAVILCAAIAAALEVLIVARLSGTKNAMPDIGRLAGVGRFIAAALIAAGVAGVLLGVATTTIGGNGVAAGFSIFASHASAIILVTPCVILPRERRGMRPLGSIAVLLVSLGVTTVVFLPGTANPIAFVSVVFVLWAAFTQSLRVAYAHAVLVIVLATVLTVLGGGPFAMHAGGLTTANLVQLYAVVLIVTVLCIGSSQIERERASSQRDGSRRILHDAFARAKGGYVILQEGAGARLEVVEINPIARDLMRSELTPEDNGRSLQLSPTSILAVAIRTLGDSETLTITEDSLGGAIPVSARVEALERSDYGRVYLIQIDDLRDARDVQARMAARLAREQQVVQALREINDQRDTFIASVTHELRTPLTSITGFAEELVDQPATEKQHSYAEIILRNANRMLELVENLLAAARQRRDSQLSEAGPVDLVGALSQSIDDLRYEIRRRQLVVDSFSDPRSVIVRANETDLARVLTNLLTNAIKFSPDGGVIDVSVTRGEGSVRLVIRDHGLGIPEGDHERVFDSFYRSTNATDSGIAGTGLGLPIVRDLLAGMNASVRLVPAEGGGTAAEVTFPAFDHECSGD